MLLVFQFLLISNDSTTAVLKGVWMFWGERDFLYDGFQFE